MLVICYCDGSGNLWFFNIILELGVNDYDNDEYDC